MLTTDFEREAMETIGRTIFEQIGGNRFAAMTGAKQFVLLENGLRFRIGKNNSKANFVEITLNGKDLYDMKFIRYRRGYMKLNKEELTVKMVEEKVETVELQNDLYADQLEEVFRETTGLETRLPVVI